MAVYVLKREDDRLAAYRDGDYVTSAPRPRVSSVDAYRTTALCLRANVINRGGDDAPVFAAPADDEECVVFAQMLNAEAA